MIDSISYRIRTGRFNGSKAGKQRIKQAKSAGPPLSRSVNFLLLISCISLVFPDLATCPIQTSVWKPLSNQLAHSTNGNRSAAGRGIRLAAWNAGSAFLHNKINEIEAVISKNRPHLLVISEANLHRDHDIQRVQIPNYKLLVSKTLANNDLKYSRVVMYVHNSIVADLREDLMDDNISSIWVSLGFKYQRRILVGGLYREWQLLGRNDNGVSLSETAQLSRWKVFLSQWERAIAEDKETIVLGDVNIDWLTCLEPNPTSQSKAYRTRHLLEQLTSRILPVS